MTSLTALPAVVLVRIFLCFAFGYFLSYALRSVNAVIAPELVDQFKLNAEQLGKLTSAYLLAFALMQIPLGIWLDRYGPRRTEAGLLLVAAVGCVLFAIAEQYWMLWLARALIGIGVCGCFMASLVGFRRWFAPGMQASLAAYMLVAGTLGVLTTTVPVQWVVGLYGWRLVFWVTAVLIVLSSAALWLGLPADPVHPQGADAKASEQPESSSHLGGLLAVLREPFFWRMGILAFLFVGGFIAFQSLWLGPWLNKVMGYTPVETARKLFVFNLVLMFAYLAMGSWLPKVEQSGWPAARLVIPFNLIGLGALTGLAVFTQPSYWWLWLILACSTTVNTVLQPQLAMRYPSNLSGRANTLFNLLIFAGAFCWQWLLGALIEFFRSSGLNQNQAYQASMLTYVLLGALGLLLYFIWRPAPPDALRPAP